MSKFPRYVARIKGVSSNYQCKQVWVCGGVFLYQVKWYQCTCQVRCCLPLSLPVEAPAPRVCDPHMSETQYDALHTLDIVFTLAPAESRRRTTMRCKRDAAMSKGDVPCWGVTRSKSAPGQQATGYTWPGMVQHETHNQEDASHMPQHCTTSEYQINPDICAEMARPVRQDRDNRMTGEARQ